MRSGNSALLRHVKHGLKESAFLLFAALALYLALALVTYDPRDPGWSQSLEAGTIHNMGGWMGARFADVALYFLGFTAYLLPLGLAFAGWLLFRRGAFAGLDALVVLFRSLGALVTLVAGSALAHLYLPLKGLLPGSPGGVLGDVAADALIGVFSLWGGSLFLLALCLTGLTLATGLSWLALVDLAGRLTLSGWDWLLGLGSGLGERVGEGLKRREEKSREEESRARPTALLEGPPPKPIREVPVGRRREAEQEEPVWDLEPETGEPPMVASRRPPQLDEHLEGFGPAAGGADPVDSEQPRATAKVTPFPGTRREPVLREETVAALDGDGAWEAEWEEADPPRRSAAQEPQAVDQSPARKPAPARATGEVLPPLALLDPAQADEAGYSPEELENMSRQLEVLLEHFGVKVNVVAVEPGPVITRFELEPAPGVKVSQISNLAKDLARGLSVMAERVVEVIPGKSVVGLEIPNLRREIVYLSEILGSPAYTRAKSPLTLTLGKDIGGSPVVADLAKMPHLLVAGTTGSGKSVAINAMLLSMLYKTSPDQVRLILVDPKMLELSVYEGIPHLLAPVVTDMKEAANALRWCVAEMERRYRLMAALKVRNIAGFNKKVEEARERGEPLSDPLYRQEEDWAEQGPEQLEPLPYIVVVIDELADMMMIVGKKVEELIARLAQKARAAGIHLILATQRPSVDVITGLIKANIPTRIAFQVSSRVDSRTILDQMGAEQLLGHGDMLYLPPGSGFPQRVHGAFVDDQEVMRVVEFLKEQGGEPDYREDILGESQESLPGIDTAPGGGGGGDEGEGDALYDQAVAIVLESRKASISYVQRRLKIGYNRAARMVEEMENAGVVGPLQANGSREVLAPPPPQH
ncbi:MAG: DNA translocase FtsK 4TM domain-containing protein [Candidatus Competibacteraceae bacterium]|nr:DNA translocase FtsK 4TM domain-containing protein [Candidatus Competibacteraceae bacterium]